MTNGYDKVHFHCPKFNVDKAQYYLNKLAINTVSKLPCTKTNYFKMSAEENRIK